MSAEWLHWYYLIYMLPAFIAVLVLLMSGLSGHHGGHTHAAHGGLHLHAHASGTHTGAAGGHTAHTPIGADAPAAPGVHATAASPAHAHTHGGHTGHSGGRSTPTVGRQLLGFFGVGRAPITIVAGSLMMGWGLFGWGATELLRPILRWPVLFIGPSMAAAAAGALLSAKLFAELCSRLMPNDESCAIPREGLLGLTGKVVYPVSETGGRVHIYDSFRTLHVEPARVGSGQAPIEKGTEVMVASMDPDRRYLIVEPLGFTRSPVSIQPSAVREESQLEARHGDL